MTWPRLARAVAWLVALAGVIDPALTVTRDVPATLRVVTVVTPSLALPAEGGGTRQEAIASGIAALEASLGPSVRVERVAAAPLMSRDWCAGADACVFAGDGSAAPTGTAAALPHFALVAAASEAPNVAVVAVEAAPVQHPGGFGRVRASLEGWGVAETTTTLRVMDAGHERGRVTHTWTEGAGRAEVVVPWWPVERGRRVLRVEAVPFEGESTSLDNAAVVTVEVSAAPYPVLVYEARPSWAATFVRRALEADPRLSVSSRSRVRPGVTVTTPAAPALTAGDLDGVRVVVVGGLDALSRAEVDLLDRFAARRGGAVVLVPDMLPSGPARALLPGRLAERLVARPVAVGPLHATEVLTFGDLSPADRVVATLDDGAAAAVERPLGGGRVVVSGALDAWRHRQDPEAFDAHWVSLVARVAEQAGGTLTIEPRHARTTPDAPVSFEVRWRSMDSGALEWPALSAWVTCNEGGQRPVRGWPLAEPGAYRLEVRHAEEGECVAEAALAARPDATAGAVVTVTSMPDRVSGRDAGALERLARSRGGAAYTVRDAGALATAIDASLIRASAPRDMHPLRSPWWLVAVAAALGGEWWWRRRQGLR